MQYKSQLLILLFICLFLAMEAQENKGNVLFKMQDYRIAYDFNHADRKWTLPNKLVEVSGLSFIDKDRLACVQDEKGNIYIFNSRTGEVEDKVDFAEHGDYEGIEVVGKDAWVLKSNGTLYHVKDFLSGNGLKTKKYATELSGRNDAEGLGYDRANNALLIACKGHPFVDEKRGKEFKAVYRFDLNSHVLDLKPYMLIEMDSIKIYKEYNTMARLGVELLAYIDESKGDVSFQPSGIAIHPHTGDIYILAAVGNLVLIYSADGNMQAMIKLKSKYHPQPEGICFDAEGTLYIANEGDNNDGSIQRFGMVPNNK